MKVTVGFEATGTLDVQYGAYRLQVAEWAGIHPSEVTARDAAQFAIAYEEENGVSWAYAHRAEQEGRQP